MVQHCDACQRDSMVGAKYCPHCLSPLRWVPASSRATLHTYAVVHQKSHPGFADEVPYVIATGKLAEGPLMSLRLIGSDAASLRIGAPLQVGFLDNGEAEPTPVFRPVSS